MGDFALTDGAHPHHNGEGRLVLVQIGANDLDWCLETAKTALAHGSVEPSKGPLPRPGLVCGCCKWSYSDKAQPEDCVTGGMQPGGQYLLVHLPSASNLKVWFSRDLEREAGFTSFVAGVVLHELVHFRQHNPVRTDVNQHSSAEEFLAYYENEFEREAHGAQIAYALSVNGPVDADLCFSTLVGARIAERLRALDDGPMADAARKARDELVAEVNRWLSKLANIRPGEEVKKEEG